jgi:hypothetical protein
MRGVVEGAGLDSMVVTAPFRRSRDTFPRVREKEDAD